MSNRSINQNEVNSAVWAACDTFRGTIDSSIYKDFATDQKNRCIKTKLAHLKKKDKP